MLDDALSLMPLWTFVLALCVAFGAGIVKGAIGFALPLIIMSGLSLFLDPLVALGGVIFPALFSNVWQVVRFKLPDIKDALAEHWRYVLIVCVMILIVAQIVTYLPGRVLYLVLGVPVVVLSLIQLFGVQLTIPPHRKRLSQWAIGSVAGMLGGVTGSWGPPTVLYLMALGTSKARQVLVQGVVYSISGVSLVLGHLQSGVLNATTAWFSAVLLIPTFIGMWLGFYIGDRLDADKFRKITLIVLVVAGVNLVRRGLFG